VLENSEFIIQRYRSATIALGYNGDSVANSLGDIISCGFGFYLARRIGWRWSVAVIIVTELVLLLWIRDNLLLNIVMLILPIDAIKTWQTGP
jgi:predicted MFS family arabinose efflux permease